jgi:hypothetical protein
MEEYDRNNYHTKTQNRPRTRGTSQRAPDSFGDDFGDGFSGGKVKVKEKNIVHRSVPYINASRTPPTTTRSRPRYKRGTALIMSSADDSDSTDELNLCGPQSETQPRSRRAGCRTLRPLSSSLEWKQSTLRNECGLLQSPARGARAFGKQGKSRVANAVSSPSKKADLPLVTIIPDRIASSSSMSLRRSPSSQRASRVVTHPVMSTSSSEVPLHLRPSLCNLHSLATPGDCLTKPVQPKNSSTRRRREELSPPFPDRSELHNKQNHLVKNRLRSEKRNKKPLLRSQKGEGTTISSTSTDVSTSTLVSGSSKASTRSGRKRFESDGESSSRQRGEVPWADLVNFSSSPVLTTPKSRRTETSKSSQSSSVFPMDLTPPDLRMKKQATLDKLDRLLSSAPDGGSGRRPKRKRSSMREASGFSDKCAIDSEPRYVSNSFTAPVLLTQQ